MWKTIALFAAVASIALMTTACGGAAVDCSTNPDYATCVAPIFDAKCGGSSCHGGGNIVAGLTLVGAKAADLVGKDAQGANSGTKWIVANAPNDSLIYLKIQAEGDRAKAVKGGRMPIGKTMTAAEIGTVKLWIEKGAK